LRTYRELEAKAGRVCGTAGAAAIGAKDLGCSEMVFVEQRSPIDRLSVGDEFVVRPGEKVALPTVFLS